LIAYRILEAVEREETNIAVTDLWVDGKLEISPDAIGRGFFQIRFARDRLVLYAGQYVGLIPLNSHVAINVKPKTTIPNLLRLIGRSDAKIHALSFFPVEYQPVPFRPLILLEPIASALLEQLRRIDIIGLQKQYELHVSHEPPIRGRILFGESLARFGTRGLNHRATFSYFDLTPDLLPNRVLRSAVQFLLQQFRLVGDPPVRMMRELVTYRDLFSSQRIREAWPHELPGAKIAASRIPNPGYQEAVKLALLILEGRGVQLPPGSGSVKLPSFLLDMAAVFESYVRESLKKTLQPAFNVVDGNREGARPLYDEKGVPLATPDVLVCAGKDVRLICDVKYKLNPTREDVNQILAYALRYSAPKTLLICLSPSPVARLELLGTVSGIELNRYDFPLSAVDLSQEEARISEAVRNLCAAPSARDAGKTQAE